MESDVRGLFLDKHRIRQIMAQQNERIGFVPDPTATPERAQEAVEASLRENGVRPEDNVFSCGIVAARGE